MSGGPVCKCGEHKKPIDQRKWVILDYKCNHSAFNGWKKTPSKYSAILCQVCRYVWRTKSKYVMLLKQGGYEET